MFGKLLMIVAVTGIVTAFFPQLPICHADWRQMREEAEDRRRFMEEMERLNREEWQRADEQAQENILREEERRAEEDERLLEKEIERMEREQAERERMEQERAESERAKRQQEVQKQTDDRNTQKQETNEEKEKYVDNDKTHSNLVYIVAGIGTLFIGLIIFGSIHSCLAVLAFFLLPVVIQYMFNPPRIFFEGYSLGFFLLIVIVWVSSKLSSGEDKEKSNEKNRTEGDAR